MDKRGFIYNGKKLSDLGYMMAYFDPQDDIPLGLDRTMQVSNANQYREQVNTFGANYDNVLEFSFGIMKDFCNENIKQVTAISEDDLHIITSWLTSSSTPRWLQFYDLEGNILPIRYRGNFTKIVTYAVGDLYGLTLTFHCSSSFAYTNDINYAITCNGQTNLSVNNNSDRLEDYCYPIVIIQPTAKEQIFIHNISDSIILEEGAVTVPSGATSKDIVNLLITQINTYATNHGYTVIYNTLNDATVTLCNDSAIQFKFTSSNGTVLKCFAYISSTGSYKIFRNGFMYFSVSPNLQITIDSQKMKIYDSLNRSIDFEDLGIEAVDEMYWLRLINGQNDLYFYGTNCTFKITYYESRKVGAF